MPVHWKSTIRNSAPRDNTKGMKSIVALYINANQSKDEAFIEHLKSMKSFVGFEISGSFVSQI